MEYFLTDPDIISDTRIILISKMVTVIRKYGLQQSTLHLAIIIFDKYLITETVEKKSLIKTIIVCLVIASKVEEIHSLLYKDALSIIDIICDSDGNCFEKDLVELETKILIKLNYKLYYNTVMQRVKIIHEINSTDLDDYYFSLFISMGTLLSTVYLFIDPNELAHKITDYCNLLSSDQETIEKSTQNDNWYLYIYSIWSYIINSKYDSIQQYFLRDKYNKISSKTLPKNINIPTNFMVYSKKIWYSDSDQTNINIYQKEIIEKAHHINNLGQGAFGTVRHVKLLTNEHIAIKTLRERLDDYGMSYSALREINSLIILTHPNIIKIHGFYFDPEKRLAHIGLELMSNTLTQHMRTANIKAETKILYIQQLLEGLHYMHGCNIMHRDLSTDNILVSRDGILKISDFGSSRNFHHPSYTMVYSDIVCSLYFRPIEILLGKLPYTPSIDVWSCACVIVYILQKNLLFLGTSENEMLLNIYTILGTPQCGFYEDVRMWPKFKVSIPVYPRKGLSNLEKNYPFETEIIYKMLDYIPEKRIKIIEALKLFKDYHRL